MDVVAVRDEHRRRGREIVSSQPPDGARLTQDSGAITPRERAVVC